MTTPPRWDLTNVYPALNSPEFTRAFADMQTRLGELETIITGLEALNSQADIQGLKNRLGTTLEFYNELLVLAGTLQAYIHSFVSTDSFNTEAMRKLSEFEQIGMTFEVLTTRLQRWIGSIAPAIPELTKSAGILQDHAFFLNEVAEQSRYLMSQPEEELAAELNLSGGNAWGKLQGTVTSQLTWEIELDGKLQKLPMPAIINLRSHPDEATRRRGYEAEQAAWQSVREPLAAAMNGIKGTVNTINRKRGRKDALHSPLDINRIDRATLDAMLAAMRESLPSFQRYFQAKAARLGKEKLPWWDLFAPAGASGHTYTYDEARSMILENFAGFSDDLSGFAKQAITGGWVDAEQRPGKRGGAFCMGVPGVKESRILLSFDGSLDTVSTLAHELGHGYHNHCMYRAGRTELQQRTPMTLAETASIMCETILVDAALKQAAGPAEELAILETSLVGDSQVVVDIYSRFLFEKAVFEAREKSELSADELCSLMSNAQKEAYGSGLDERYLHPYMWTWKPHYYDTYLSFYNFPYTFGLLFGTGLYAIYQQRGASFVPEYQQLLASTGMGSAADLAARFGIDIRTTAFWRGSLDIINKRVERYIAL